MKNNSNKKAPTNAVSNACSADGEGKTTMNKPPKHHKKPKKVYL